MKVSPLRLVHDAGDTPIRHNTVLIIDDQSTGRMILSEIVRSIDKKMDVMAFGDPLEALEYAASHSVDLVLTDYKMPNLDGIETIRRLRRIFAEEDVPIVCVTIVNDREIRYAALEAGATDFLTRPIDRFECRARCKNLLTLRRHQLINKSRTHLLQERVDDALKELRTNEMDTIYQVAKIAAMKDRQDAEAHLNRMGKYSALLAREYGLSEQEQESIRVASSLHDIGKIGVPDQILQLQRPLSDEETKIIRTHTSIGHDLLKTASSKHLQTASSIAYYHHEKVDGSGYPNGLKGIDIPLEARMVAIAEVYEALTTKRPYKDAWSEVEAFEYLNKHKGSHFDEKLADLFLAKSDEIISVGKDFADLKNK